MEGVSWLDGAYVQAPRVDARDAGLLHGAGVFTTLRATGGRALFLPEHLARLRASCRALHVPLPYDDVALTSAVQGLLQRNALPEARLRVTVTRGRSEVDPLHGEVHHATTLISATQSVAYPPETYAKGLVALLNSEQKANPYDVQAGHKTLNYLSRFAALREAARRGAGESLWFDVHNMLQSGSISNVFLVESGVIVTPPTNDELREAEAVRASCPYPRSCVLPGVTRAWVMRQREASEVRRLPIDVNRLLAADEVFVTNSVMGVMPVTRLEQHVVGDGSPGPVTRELSEAWGRVTEA